MSWWLTQCVLGTVLTTNPPPKESRTGVDSEWNSFQAYLHCHLEPTESCILLPLVIKQTSQLCGPPFSVPQMTGTAAASRNGSLVLTQDFSCSGNSGHRVDPSKEDFGVSLLDGISWTYHVACFKRKAQN